MCIHRKYIYLLAFVYLSIPLYLFLLSWLHIYYGAFCTVVLLFCAYRIFQHVKKNVGTSSLCIGRYHVFSLLLILLFIFQIMIFYKFISLAIRLKAKQIVITSLYRPKSKKIFFSILALAFGINIVSSIGVWLLTKELVLILIMLSFLILEMLILMTVSAIKLKKHRVQILKGEVEVVWLKSKI